MKNPIKTDVSNTSSLVTLEQMLAKTCFCKLREFCDDKNGSECLRNKNIYDEFMQQKHTPKA
jgi:hypothetical protein